MAERKQLRIVLGNKAISSNDEKANSLMELFKEQEKKIWGDRPRIVRHYWHTPEARKAFGEDWFEVNLDTDERRSSKDLVWRTEPGGRKKTIAEEEIEEAYGRGMLAGSILATVVLMILALMGGLA